MDIESHSFFKAFHDEGRRRLLVIAERRTFEDGFCLFMEDDPADVVYLVISGEIKLTKRNPRSGDIVLTSIFPDDYLGDMGVIDRCARCTSAFAVGTTEVVTIAGNRLREIIRNSPSDVGLHFLERISDRLRRTNALYVDEVLRKERMQLVGEMASAIIHDFKNPMTTIQCAVAMIRRKGGPGAESYCKLIERRVVYMEAMTRELLDFSRGRSELSREPVSLEELFEEAGAANEAYLDSHGIACVVEPIDVDVSVDRCRIQRVLQNLVTNAAEAFGTRTGSVTLRAERVDEGMVEIQVVDNGPGIPEEIRSTLFEPFVTAGKPDGIGLGMAIVKTVVEGHDGTITFDTETGQGTTFRVRLPTVSAG